MNTERIRKLTLELDTATRLARDLRFEADTLRLDHQGEIAVTVPNCIRVIRVAVNGGREAGWGTRMVRGREMIMLGIKKAYAAMIEDADDRVSKITEEIAMEIAV